MDVKITKRGKPDFTPMMKRYLVKLGIRLFIFFLILFGYITAREYMYRIVKYQVFWQITPLHVLWCVFMLMMILHIFPTHKLSMAGRKSKEYDKAPDYEELELHRFVQDQNLKAWRVMLVWLIFNSIFGLLYLLQVIDEADLLMLTVFYFLGDYICILFFCPFQTFIMKNKCCVNCRIYDWGHFMMFTPMLFIRNFFSWSLFFTACIVLIHWEVLYAKYPERFFSGSNRRLQCQHCKDRTCRMKKHMVQ